MSKFMSWRGRTDAVIDAVMTSADEYAEKAVNT